MSYTYYYRNVFNPQIPQGSRAVATTYNGMSCPQSLQFGRVHGTSPATGEVTFKGSVLLPILDPIILQIGQSVFYGIAIKGGTDQSTQQGSNTTFSMVDMRDRLHDINVFAQFNMVSNGEWWHNYAGLRLYSDFIDGYNVNLFFEKPELYDFKRNTYILGIDNTTLLNSNVFTLEQNIINILNGQCSELFSAYNILKLLIASERTPFGYYDGVTVSVTFSSQQIEDYLKLVKPINLDFSRGIKLVDAIQAILEPIGLQFTVWGDLNIHISRRGFPESMFETQLMAGQIDLCSFGSYVDSSIGSEVNEKGRRYIVLGGNNLHENWYRCFPDWNFNWTAELCNDIGAQCSALLIKNNLMDLNLLKELPVEYHDLAKYNGLPRNEMTIRDYINEVCFKIYRIDFKNEGFLKVNYGILDVGNLIVIPPDPSILVEDDFQCFQGFGIITLPEPVYNDHVTPYPDQINSPDSENPISSHLVSDSERQMIIIATTFPFSGRGLDEKEFLESSKLTYISNGASLEVEEYLTTETMDNLIDSVNRCHKRFKCRLIFGDRRYNANPQLGVNNNNQQFLQTNITSDKHIYVKLAVEEGSYNRFFGEDLFVKDIIQKDYRVNLQRSTRIRETVIDRPTIRKGFIDKFEVPILIQNFISQGILNAVMADEVAFFEYVQASNNELITTSGHVTFRSAAGFMPSGIIDSVNVSFQASTGVREVINFTDARIDSQNNPNYYDISIGKQVKGEDELKAKVLQEESKRILTLFGIGGIVRSDETQDDQFNNLARMSSFGERNNAAQVAMDINEIDSNLGLLESEVIIVRNA